MTIKTKHSLVAICIAAAISLVIYSATALGSEHSMRGLLAYILACTAVSVGFTTLFGVYLVERINAFSDLVEQLNARNATAQISAFSYSGCTESKEYPQERQRRELEQTLVNGAAHDLSREPKRATEIATGIKNFLNELHSVDPGADSLERDIQAKANKAPRA